VALGSGDTLGEGEGKSASLWLNLSDGFIGGGRAVHPFFLEPGQSSGGNNTAIDHYAEMLQAGKNYPLAVKLGTITRDGAEVFSYAEDEDGLVFVPPERLAELLSKWGINMTRLHQTERMTEELDCCQVQEALRRRRKRIPKNATHSVFAYQLGPWNATEIKQLDTFKQRSGEISLASYGGFIYFKADEYDAAGEVVSGTVVGVNAISLISHETGRPAFADGTINRHDDQVSAPVASPELWEGVDIGLESDIYSFGIVMWVRMPLFCRSVSACSLTLRPRSLPSPPCFVLLSHCCNLVPGSFESQASMALDPPRQEGSFNQYEGWNFAATA